jgi:hypothetical protein
MHIDKSAHGEMVGLAEHMTLCLWVTYVETFRIFFPKISSQFPISPGTVYDFYVSVCFPQNAASDFPFFSLFPFSSETDSKFPFRFQPYRFSLPSHEHAFCYVDTYTFAYSPEELQ